jgi:hypothetical protein
MKIMKKSTGLILLLIAMLFSGLSAWSQERHHRPGPPGSGPPQDERDGRGPGHGPRHHGPPGADFDFLSSEMRFGDKMVKGSPFSAQVVIENVQTLADGTKLTRKTTGSLYRDGEGRTRREQEMGFMGPFAPTGDAPHLVFISDPVGGNNYALNPVDKTARKMRPFNGEPPPPNEQPQQPGMQAKSETLTKQVMEGVEVEGTRSTVTIPIGQIGNNNPLEIVSERWYSPDLQIAVMTKHSDPRWGVMTYRLTNIKREEPPHSLFTVPSDYRIEENFPRGKRRMDD